MFTKKHIINNISLVLLIIIGAIFVYKYSSRLFGYFPIAAIVYILLCLIIIAVISNLKTENSKFINRKNITIFLVASTIIGLAVIPIIPETTGVARLPAIKEWISNLSEGKFPYITHSNSSGFPFLYFVSFPFYIIGELGYLELIGYLMFWICLLYFSKSVKTLLVRIILLFVMPVFYYEFLVRSELFFNISLAITLIILTYRYLNQDKIDFRFIAFAILYGLILSTRFIVGVLYIIYLLYFFRQNLLKLFLFAAIAILTFLITVLPFILWNSRFIIEGGPFGFQLQYVPRWALFLFLIFSVFTGWIVADLREVFFATGLILFLLVTAAFIYYIYYSGLQKAFFGKFCFDFSYYVFSVPFLILSIDEYTIDKFLLKVYFKIQV